MEAHKSPIATEAVERIARSVRDRERDPWPAHRMNAAKFATARPGHCWMSMRDWLETSLSKLSRKSDTSAAIHYALARWDALVRYCDDGRIEIDNSPPNEPCAQSPWDARTTCSPVPTRRRAGGNLL